MKRDRDREVHEEKERTQKLEYYKEESAICEAHIRDAISKSSKETQLATLCTLVPA